jgi:hypothetical protein
LVKSMFSKPTGLSLTETWKERCRCLFSCLHTFLVRYWRLCLAQLGALVAYG